MAPMDEPDPLGTASNIPISTTAYLLLAPSKRNDTNTRNDTKYFDNCEPIHISFFVQDFPSITKMTRTLKSLMFYRQTSIELHVIVANWNDRNTSLTSTLGTIFKTWNLKHFHFNIYSTSLQYDGAFPIQRLHTVLPETVKNVIFLDVNAIMNTDITELWMHFNKMQATDKVFGAVKNSVVTTTANGEQCPMAILVLIDLQAIRKNTDLRNMLTSTNTMTYKLREMISKYCYDLPCKWNVRIGKCSTDFKGCHSYDNIGILVYEEPDNLSSSSNNDFVMHARYLQQLWMQMDSGLLETRNIPCGKVEKPKKRQHGIKQLTKVKSCREIYNNSSNIYRTHKYFIGGKYESASPYDVTLITQFTLDRLPVILKLLTDHWNGPLSGTIYCTEYEAWQVLMQFEQHKALLQRGNIGIHVVYKSGNHFPVNYLRNVALLASFTPFVFLSDCDFLTSYDLYDYLMKSAEALQKDKSQPKRAMIVPAFESLKYNFKFPKDKRALLDQCRKGQLQIFHKNWFSGHGSTNYNKWAVARHPYPVKWMDNFEPYILIERDTPRYAEQFFGYGFNKASQIMEVKAKGYEFVVLPDSYVIHNPHPVTDDRSAFVDNKGMLFNCIQDLKKEFLFSLFKKYGRNCLKNPSSQLPAYTNITI